LTSQFIKYWEELSILSCFLNNLTKRFDPEVIKGWNDMWRDMEDQAENGEGLPAPRKEMQVAEMEVESREETAERKGKGKGKGKGKKTEVTRTAMTADQDIRRSVFQVAGIKGEFAFYYILMQLMTAY
jgi:hypothetical protein